MSCCFYVCGQSLLSLPICLPTAVVTLDRWLRVQERTGESNEEELNGIPDLVSVHVPPCISSKNDVCGHDHGVGVGEECQTTMEARHKTSTPKC